MPRACGLFPKQVFFCYPAVWLFSEGFSSFSVSFEVRARRTSTLQHPPFGYIFNNPCGATALAPGYVQLYRTVIK